MPLTDSPKADSLKIITGSYSSFSKGNTTSKLTNVHMVYIFFGSLIISLFVIFIFNFIFNSLDNQKQTIVNKKSASVELLDLRNFNTFYVLEKAKATFPIINDYEAQAIAVLDVYSNRIIYEKNAEKRMPIASITKMVTTKILYDTVNLNGITTITNQAAQYDGSSLVLRSGEKFSNRDLIKAAIIPSNNQGLYAIQDPEKTVRQANEYIQALRLRDTYISNPAGFDDNGRNYSTARDVLHIAKVFFNNQELRDYARIERSEIRELTTNREIPIYNTNDFLRIKYTPVLAGKTGTTEKAGQNLCILVEKNNKRYIIVILGSTNRYSDAIKIIDRL
ncbi:MAG: hypothetical protein KatS3mg084_0167 [Candidatus Dojkabacteria bacterium]|nr:MAG: hypothetical protein KatS3mg084_0167 [Candidatus Dojkabacteria bacterium]